MSRASLPHPGRAAGASPRAVAAGTGSHEPREHAVEVALVAETVAQGDVGERALAQEQLLHGVLDAARTIPVADAAAVRATEDEHEVRRIDPGRGRELAERR